MDKLVKQESGTLQKYDPDEGLKVVAVAEAAERYCRRAKDVNGLTNAVEAKLTAMREFVLWWDRNGTPKGGNPTITDLLRLKDFGMGNMTLSRWRTKLADEGKFDKAFEQTRQLQPNMTRDRFIRESANSFPRVAKLANDHQVRTKDARSRIRHQHKQARARKSSPTRRTTSQRANVKRVPTTRKQHVSRAQRQHRKSWSPSRATPKSSSAPRRSTGGARRK